MIGPKWAGCSKFLTEADPGGGTSSLQLLTRNGS